MTLFNSLTTVVFTTNRYTKSYIWCQAMFSIKQYNWTSNFNDFYVIKNDALYIYKETFYGIMGISSWEP